MCFRKPKLLIEEIKEGRRFFIEENNKTLYLYITREDFKEIYGIAWIANLTKAPDDYDIKAMQRGKPTRMPKENCAIPEGLTAIPNFAFKWEENLLLVYANEELVCKIENPFAMPIAFCKYIIGETRYGIELD